MEESTATKIDLWGERIAEHGRRGLSVKEFCKELGLSARSFYCWRKRLRESGPMRFASMLSDSCPSSIRMLPSNRHASPLLGSVLIASRKTPVAFPRCP